MSRGLRRSDSWRRCTCTNVLLVCEGEVGELVQPGGMWGLPWGLLCGTSGRKDLCMVPCHSCHIFGIWTSRSKKVWGMLKSNHLGVGMQATKRGVFHREGWFSLCDTAVLWNFIASLTGYILWKILLDTSFHYTTLLLYVFEVGKAKKATQSVLMILTLNGLFQKNFQVFCFTPENSISLTPLLPPLSVFPL